MHDLIKNKQLLLSDGQVLKHIAYSWHQAGPKALIILPGLDESISQYHHFFEELKTLFPTYSILAIDMRGQGETLNLEGKIKSQSIKLEDQLLILREIQNDLPIESLFIIGLSYGAGLALYFANRIENVVGLALLAPYVSKFSSYSSDAVGAWHSLFELNPFQKIVSHFTLPLYFQYARDKGVLTEGVEWNSHRLDALTKLSVGIMELDTKGESTHLGELKLGAHILIGDSDPLLPVAASEDLYLQLNSKNKSITILPGVGHRLILAHSKRCTEWLKKILNHAEDL